MMFVAAAIGTTVAWSVNYNRYGHRDARMGPLTLDGSVNADNVMEIVTKDDTLVPPKAELVGEPTHDFGVMAPNDKGEHTFVIRNAGEGDLSLELGASTCKCTLGELGKELLKPGEETEITLSWTVSTDKKFFSQGAEIRTNDPNKIVLKLEIVGTIVRKVAIVPDAWTFGEVAAGESFEVRGKLYTYFDDKVVPTEQSFSSEELTKLTDFEVLEFQPGEEDGIHSTARQGFEMIAKVKPGMRQGAIAVNYRFGFQIKDENGQIVQEEGDTDPNNYAIADVAGRIVGALSMITGTKLKAAKGSFIYNFGRLNEDDSLKAKTLIVLKGEERETTKLSIGEVSPAEAMRVNLGEPLVRKSMVLYPLEIEIVPGKKPLEYLGMKGTDFGSIWIESDNPKVAKMRLAVKFAVDPRP